MPRLLQEWSGKRKERPVLSWGLSSNSTPTSNNTSLYSSFKEKHVLDYILSHGEPGECPYLKVKILGQNFFGLLDSGANRIFVGSLGWEKLKSLGLDLDRSRSTTCTVASNETCECIGIVSAPIQVRDVVKLFDLYVVPKLRHEIVLGIDFWKKMGVVPDMRRGEWFFSSEVLVGPQINQIHSEDDLSAEQVQQLNCLVSSYFEKIGDKLGCTSAVQHKITTNSPPIKQRYYPVSPYKQKIINEELDKMLRDGIVEPSKSAWSSPVLLVPKPNGEHRFCVDFRKLNSVSERDAYPLPYISTILDKLGGARYMSSLDLKNAYWQVPLEEKSKQYTAFTVPGRGLFQFTRLPFGLHNAPATFQRLVDQILGDLDFVFRYIDDVVLITADFESHLKLLEEVFMRLHKNGLTLNREKCQFCRPELKYLGYIVNRQGVSVDPAKVEAITGLTTPKSVRDVRRIIGMISYYRKFIPAFSTIISPLTNLLRKNVRFQWTNTCEEAFQEVKNCLVSAPILDCPNFDEEFILQTDASSYGIGAVLTQFYNNREHVICYISRTLSRTERLYSATERELLSVIWSVEKLRCYLDCTKFKVITDHYSLKWLHNIKDPQGRLGRWCLRLQQFNFDVIHRKGKEHVVPDALSRAVIDNPSLIGSDLEICEIQLNNIRDKWYLKLMSQVNKNPLSFPSWRVSDGKLYKKILLDYPELRCDDDFWKLVVPKENRREVISSWHSTTIGGHLGVHKTYFKVARLYYWPRMKADIARFVKGCQICQQVKPEQKLPGGLMGDTIVPSRCWQVISMDLFGPLPRSKSGNMHIFVVTDTFSKFNLFFPIKKANSKTIIKLLEERVFYCFGIPQLIRCDNGSQFKSVDFSNLKLKYGLRILYNPHYHPSPNLTERVNRIMKTMISSFVTENNQRDWDIDLPILACATNTSKHSVTGQTPYFINFGVEMKLHGSEYEDKFHDSNNRPLDSELKAKTLVRLRELVSKNMEKAHQIAKKQYDLRRRQVDFTIGDLVWKKKFTLSDAGNYYTAKLGGKFEGPFKISKKCGYCTYELETLENKPLKGRWHTQDLKPFHEDNFE